MNLDSSNILIVKYSSLGDVVNAVPAVRFLRRNCPNARIYWVVREEYASLISGLPFIDGVVIYGDFFDTVRKARSLGIDCAVDLQGLFKSGLLAYLSGARTRACFPHTREGSAVFYTRKFGLARKDIHAVTENLSVVEGLLGKRFSGACDFGISLNRAADLRDVIGRAAREFVALSPTSRWGTKMWGGENFAALSDMLVRRMGVDVVFTGTAADAAYIEGIRQGMKNPSVNLAGKTDVKSLAGLFKEASVVVSCDSGAMHLASAMGTPVVAVFGPTDPSYTGPFGKNSIVISAGEDCSPCRKRRCGSMKCMEGITPEMVFEGVMKVASIKV